MLRSSVSLLLGASFALVANVQTLNAEPLQQHSSNAVWFENWIGLSNATLVVAAPNGTFSEIYAESGTPVFELRGAQAVDGIYRYELRAAMTEQAAFANRSNAGVGGTKSDTTGGPFYTTGQFTVERGVIITPREIKEEEDG